MNKPVLRSTQMKNVNSLLNSTFGATTTSFRNANDYSGQNLTGKDFRGQDLTDANFTNANLTNANLTRANLTRAVFTNANLTNAILTRAKITDANFTNAILYSADLTGANLKGANLTRANLTGANMIGAQFTTIDFNDIIFSDELRITASLSSGGSAFLEVVPSKISINGGDIVDSITINDIRFGGGGGSGSEIITLRVNEYINEIAYSFNFSFYGYVCNYLEFKTSLGTTIKAGNEDPRFIQRLKNIRLRKISGRSGDYVDNLTFILVK